MRRYNKKAKPKHSVKVNQHKVNGLFFTKRRDMIKWAYYATGILFSNGESRKTIERMTRWSIDSHIKYLAGMLKED